MKNELLSKTLAQIVNENFQTAMVFEKYDLDFCCKGKRSLEKACEEKQLSTEIVLTDLNKVLERNQAGVVDFNQLTLSGLADYIVSTHHAYTKKELPQIFFYLEKVSSKHGDRHNELYHIFELFVKLKEEMEMHMGKEELVLFPRIKELEQNIEGYEPGLNIQLPVLILEDEHEHAGNLLKEMRALANNFTPPADACTTYKLSFAALQALEADLHQHIHLENNVLFPKAIELYNQKQKLVLN